MKDLVWLGIDSVELSIRLGWRFGWVGNLVVLIIMVGLRFC